MYKNDGRKDYIKKHLTIPQYFNMIILPERSDYYTRDIDLHAYPRCICPLHDEKTPSFNYNAETETFKCYGCGCSGDVIELHKQYMLTYHNEVLSWNELLTQLYNYIKLGNLPINVTPTIINKANKLNSSSDILQFKIMLARIIPQIKKANISVEQKMQIINLVDLYRTGVLHNSIAIKETLTPMLKEIEAHI